MNSPLTRVFALVALLSSGFMLPRLASQPVERAELEALRARVRELEAQLQAIAHRLDLAVVPARTGLSAPAGGDAGAARAPIEPRDAAPQPESLRLRTLLHVDARSFTAGADNDTLALRRARLAAEGALLPRARYVLMADFGGGGVNLLDANVAFELGKRLQFRAGKFKSPLGLEVLHPAHAVTFTERSVVSALLPNRDVGLQLSARGAEGAIAGTIGVFNGVVDGAHGGNFDTDQQREAIGRVMVAPFRRSPVAAGRGFTFGVGGSLGRRNGPAGLPAAYRSPGQEAAFTYRPGVVADGVAWRVSPQFEYRHGPLGLFGEHAVSALRVRPAETAAALELRHRAWQLTAGYVLTGEDSSAAGVVPRADFEPATGAWGGVRGCRTLVAGGMGCCGLSSRGGTGWKCGWNHNHGGGPELAPQPRGAGDVRLLLHAVRASRWRGRDAASGRRALRLPLAAGVLTRPWRVRTARRAESRPSR